MMLFEDTSGDIFLSFIKKGIRVRVEIPPGALPFNITIETISFVFTVKERKKQSLRYLSEDSVSIADFFLLLLSRSMGY